MFFSKHKEKEDNNSPLFFVLVQLRYLSIVVYDIEPNIIKQPNAITPSKAAIDKTRDKTMNLKVLLVFKKRGLLSIDFYILKNNEL